MPLCTHEEVRADSKCPCWFKMSSDSRCATPMLEDRRRRKNWGDTERSSSTCEKGCAEASEASW
eukprot:5981909-Pleurochrysis_carterae.AAC.1